MKQITTVFNSIFTDHGQYAPLMPNKIQNTYPNPSLQGSIARSSFKWTALQKSIMENAYLLLPSIIGTGIASLISLKPEHAQYDCNMSQEITEPAEKKNRILIDDELSAAEGVKFIAVAYVFGSICGIAAFIYKSVIESPLKHPYTALFPIGIGLLSAILLFASVDLAMYVVFPASFSGKIGKTWGKQVISFLYYSALSISVGPVGDILPTESSTRLLLAMEGLVNLVIFSLLIALIFAK